MSAKKESPLTEIEPWDSVVNGQDMLDQMASTIREYVVLSEDEAITIALWVVYSHAHDAFDIASMLNITSPTRESGKSLTLDVIECMVTRPMSTSSISPSAIFRTIDSDKPTLLIDEFDNAFAMDLKAILNSSHRKKKAKVTRVVGEGPNAKRHDFSTWAPIVAAGIGELPDTLHSRAVRIKLRRKLRTEHTKQFRYGKHDDLDKLGRMAARWAADNFDALKNSNPSIPAELTNRRADVWSSLLAVADQCGGHWPVKAREVALRMEQRDTPEEGEGVRLLKAIRDIFEEMKERGDTRTSVPTAELLAGVRLKDDGYWMMRGKSGLSDETLARLLKPFGIGPDHYRDGGGSVRGYHMAMFQDSFARFLPPLKPSTTGEPANATVT